MAARSVASFVKGLPMPSAPPSHDSSIPIKAAHLRTKARYRLLADLRKTWGKFGDDELRHLRDMQDLVSQLVLRYGMDEEQARREADAVVGGRSL
jgi:hypothetical protein